MTPVDDQQLAKLAPYIAGARPDDRNEVEMFCPLHRDKRRSASLNTLKGAWFCHAGCGGSSVERLIDAEDTWVDPPAADLIAGRSVAATQPKPRFRPTLRHVNLWHNSLRANPEAQKRLEEVRGITAATMRGARVGWHEQRHVYVIPIYGWDGELVSVRYYDPDPGEGRRKIWSIKGMGKPVLYPIRLLLRADPEDPILFCEGEWDALLSIQTGALGCTRTGAAKVWRDEWTPLFSGRRVYLCHDADYAGVEGDRLVARKLSGVAEVLFCRLPYPVTEKHGKDLTDLILERGPDALWDLMKAATKEKV